MFKSLVLLSLLFCTPAMAKDIGIIGFIDENTTEQVKKSLKKQEIGSTVYVTINSVGGELSQAFDIVRMLKNYKTVCLVGARAMSAAMYILQECNVRAVHKESALMVHNVQVDFNYVAKNLNIKNGIFDYGFLEVFLSQVKIQNDTMLNQIAHRMNLHRDDLNLAIMTSDNLSLYLTGENIQKYRASDMTVKSMKELKDKIK